MNDAMPYLTRPKYHPGVPTPMQMAFLLCKQREVFWGTTAGEGKTEALLMAALQYVDRPHYNALILRRSYRELYLEDSVMRRAQRYLAGTDAEWAPKDRRFNFSSGATISFDYLNSDGNFHHLGYGEWQFIGIDDLTDFTRSQYDNAHSRLRGQRDVPLRMRSVSNRYGDGIAWIEDYFTPLAITDRYFLNRGW